MNDAEFRRRAHALLMRLGHVGGCVECGKPPFGFRGVGVPEPAAEVAALRKAGTESERIPVPMTKCVTCNVMTNGPERWPGGKCEACQVKAMFSNSCCPCCGGAGPPCPPGQGRCCVRSVRTMHLAVLRAALAAGLVSP